jgi:predicted dehydrogenase
MPFLKAGLPVFVDKPLSLSVDELRLLKPFLESGQLMSCSGMRFAKELDEARASIGEYGRLTLVRGAIVLSWEKYGVHLLDAILPLVKARPVSTMALKARHSSIAITLEDGTLLQIDALGDVPRTFRIDIWGSQRASTHEITDNFSMFRRMLWHFLESIKTRKPAIPPQDTLDVMRTLIAGRLSQQQGRTILLDEIQL